MDALMLTSLVDLPINLSKKNDGAKSFRPNGRFMLPVLLISYADAALTWTPVNPLILSYRWFDKRANCLVPDGIRTSLPVARLEPGVEVEVDLVGSAPSEEGHYTLKVSLVLEGVHWACDVGSEAWCAVYVELTPPIPWPVELTTSRGAKALRGAIAAAEMSRRVKGRTFVVDAPRSGLASDTSEATVDSTMKFANDADSLEDAVSPQFAQRADAEQLTKEVGAGHQIDDLLEIASRQERRISELLAIIGDQDCQFREMSEHHLAEIASDKKASEIASVFWNRLGTILETEFASLRADQDEEGSRAASDLGSAQTSHIKELNRFDEWLSELANIRDVISRAGQRAIPKGKTLGGSKRSGQARDRDE